MADLTYAQARALIQSDPLTAFAMLLSGNQPDGTAIDTVSGGGVLPASLGQKTAANSLPATIASDQSALPVAQIVATAGAETRVASSATNVTLLAANANRAGLLIHNNSTAILYIKYGATASITASSESYTVQIASQGNWAMPEPMYTGQIDAIWASANGFAMVTETT